MKNLQGSATSAWNLPELLNRVDNDQELLLDLLSIFQQDCPRTLGLLQAAVAGGSQDVGPLSHTLKGMFSNLAGSRAAAAAAKLELLGKAGETASFPAAFGELQREAAQLASEIDAYMAEVHM